MSHSSQPSKKPEFDFLQFLRRPHGIAVIALVLGLIGWAVWTFWIW